VNALHIKVADNKPISINYIINTQLGNERVNNIS